MVKAKCRSLSFRKTILDNTENVWIATLRLQFRYWSAHHKVRLGSQAFQLKNLLLSKLITQYLAIYEKSWALHSVSIGVCSLEGCLINPAWGVYAGTVRCQTFAAPLHTGCNVWISVVRVLCHGSFLCKHEKKSLAQESFHRSLRQGRRWPWEQHFYLNN